MILGFIKNANIFWGIEDGIDQQKIQSTSKQQNQESGNTGET